MLYCTARKAIFCFFKCSEKIVFPKKLHWNMDFFVLSGKIVFLFPENMILFFGRKMKDGLSQKIHGNMIFSVHSVNMVFLFRANMISLCQKKQR